MIGVAAVSAGALAGFGALAYIAPTLRRPVWAWRARRLCRERNALAITFTGGPCPVLLPELLSVLGAHRARATFYLRGEDAGAHPDLVRELVSAGHEAGSCGRRGTRPFRAGPIAAFRDVRQGAEMIGSLVTSGSAPRYRPPTGTVSLPAALAARLEASPVDWWTTDARALLARKGATAENVAEAALAQGGAIVQLPGASPSGGAEGLRESVPRITELLCEGAVQTGLDLVTVGQALSEHGL